MRYYFGERIDGNAHVWFAHLGEERKALPLYLHVWNRSPTGFNWGYRGSGPAQLALALAAHATGNNQRAIRVHQALKVQYVARLDTDGWVLCESDLLAMIERIERAGEGLVEDLDWSDTDYHVELGGEGG